MSSVRLPEEIDAIINIELHRILMDSPERKALNEQIKNREICKPLFGLPQRLTKLYFGEKTDDDIFAKPYWYCQLSCPSTRDWSSDFPSRRFSRRSLLRRLIKDGVIVGMEFAIGVVLNYDIY